MTQLVRYNTDALNRSFLGLDRFFEDFENRFNNHYPPHNVIRHSDEAYELEFAVSGFDSTEISVKVDQDILIIEGKKQQSQDHAKYIHKGIATRDFIKKFALLDYIEIKDCTMKNGILSISLVRRVPETLKPRVIEIKSN